jgi:thiol-disulfide isomerase/thioredoxin
MSQQMNFSPQVNQLSGGELPPNSVTLVYSPSCPHCHNIMPQYNELARLAGGKFSVNAVNLMDHYHELRAGGVQVGGVPQILIRGGSSELLEYNGPRMADSIAKEAMGFMDGTLAGGKVQESTDALLGGANQSTAQSTIPAPELAGGSRRRRHHHRRSRSRSRSRRSRRHHRHHHMRGGKAAAIEGGATPTPIAGGEVAATPAAVATPTENVELTAGSRRRRRSRSRSRSRRHRGTSRWVKHAMAYAREHGVSYKVALKKARASYRRSK